MSDFQRYKVVDGVEFIFSIDFGLDRDSWTGTSSAYQPKQDTYVKGTMKRRSEKAQKFIKQLKEQAEDIEYEEVHL